MKYSLSLNLVWTVNDALHNKSEPSLNYVWNNSELMSTLNQHIVIITRQDNDIIKIVYQMF